VSGDDTTYLQALLDRVNAGDSPARDELFARAYERLRRVAGRMLRQDFPRLGQAHGTTSVLHQAFLRLFGALEEARPPTVPDFFRFASHRMRCVLIDLARRQDADPVRPDVGRGPGGRTPDDGAGDSGPGASPHDPAGDSDGPARLAAWSEFHRQAGQLPEERDVFELIWYQGLSQVDTARMLGAHPRTVSYRYKKACLRLAEQVRGFEDLLRRGG
jgi:RNA polymerase sigma factor (sigma-70 family)